MNEWIIFLYLFHIILPLFYQAGRIDKKQEILKQFEQGEFSHCDESVKTLKDIEIKHNDLYNIGCSIEKAYKYAALTHSGGVEKNLCEYFNEWVNGKKKNYTSNGENCDKVQLWEYYIENMCITLGNSSDPKNWCTRTILTYKCKNFFPYVTGFVISFFVMATVATAFFFLYNVIHNLLFKNKYIHTACV